jgi:predicted RNA-binding Zn-ribbon protein involved in translation (DUF1610 family)
MEDYPTSTTPPTAKEGVNCLSCGYNLVGVAIGERCPECGSVIMQFATQAQTSGKAIASMVLGIVSIVTCMGYGVIGMPCAILAIFFAKKARLAIQDGTAPVTSQGMASAGRVCGWVGVVLNGLMLLLLLFYLLVLIGILGAAAAGSGSNGPILTP